MSAKVTVTPETQATAREILELLGKDFDQHSSDAKLPLATPAQKLFYENCAGAVAMSMMHIENAYNL